MSEDKIEAELKRLLAEDSFTHWLELNPPPQQVFEAIGIYCQLAAMIDFHLRRIYFALRAKGSNERGPERAHLDQIIERLPAAIEACDLDLYRKAQFPELLAVLRDYLTQRNDVIHSACRWQPDGDLLVFAHANEKVGRGIKTGDAIAYWTIPQADFLANVQDLNKMAGYLTQYTATWLPKLRPWLRNYWNGEIDPDGSRVEAFFAQATAEPKEED